MGKRLKKLRITQDIARMYVYEFRKLEKGTDTRDIFLVKSLDQFCFITGKPTNHIR